MCMMMEVDEGGGRQRWRESGVVVGGAEAKGRLGRRKVKVQES